jgi:hypothetical protein
LIVASIAGIAALAAGIATGSATAAKPVLKAKCTLKLNNESKPGASSGYYLGFANCPAPFGSGLAYVPGKLTVTGSHVTGTGNFKEYFNVGTVHGTFKISGTITPTTITLTGTAKTLGGTAAFNGAKGSGKESCSTSDGGAHLTCKTTTNYTRL